MYIILYVIKLLLYFSESLYIFYSSLFFFVIFFSILHVDAKFFFQFLTSILWAFDKLEKIPDPNGFTAITTNREKWRPLREELRRSNIDWLLCKYCKLRMYLASRALSLKSMAAAIARTRNTANKSLAHEATKCNGFRNLVFLFFLIRFSHQTRFTHREMRRFAMTKRFKIWFSREISRNFQARPVTSEIKSNENRLFRLFWKKELSRFACNLIYFSSGWNLRVCLLRCMQSSARCDFT